MGMPVTVILDDPIDNEAIMERVFDYFVYVDESYSPYKETSEVSKINKGLPINDSTKEMQAILKLCEQTRRETRGYFDIWHHNKMDPSGLVKGWAIHHAALLAHELGCTNFYIEAGGDIQVSSENVGHLPWRVGIRNPFNHEEIVKVVNLSDKGIATSGTAIRGQHIYNPHTPDTAITDVASLTVIGPNIYEADRFATAAFAMGSRGIAFIESCVGFEGYMITSDKRATITSGFEEYTV